ncbi:Fic/DOC family protein [Bacteriovorax sp. BSW11_IV]|nr:Fic/DOC family protein [Bacteriovorax sp. BSW11_IV]
MFLFISCSSHDLRTSSRKIASEESKRGCVGLVDDLFNLQHTKQLDLSFHYLKHHERKNDLANYFFHPEKEDHFMVHYYTGQTGYKKMYEDLNREGPKDKRALVYRYSLNNALNSFPKFEGTVYSGAVVDEKTLKKWNFKVGEDLRFDYFLSTSSDLKIAKGFYSRQIRAWEGEKTRVLFEIESLFGRDISSKSKYAYEKEILFKSSSRFKVESISEKSLGTIFGDRPESLIVVKLKEVPHTKLKGKLTRKNAEIDPKIEIRRLINEEDWAKAQITMPDTPELYYGEDSAEDFLNAVKYVKDLPHSTNISIDLLKNIHAIATKSHFFRGYEQRRIKLAYTKGDISFQEASAYLEGVDQGRPYSRMSHEKLSGKFRTDKEDDFFHTGDHFLPEGERYFTVDDMDKYNTNPYFYEEIESRVELSKNQFKTEFHYVYSSDVENEVQNLFEQAIPFLDSAASDEEYIRLVNKLELSLMSIHPFLDGNGRAIRLFADFLYQKRDLPPVLRPKEYDFTMSLEEIYEYTIKNMNDYLELYSK